MPVQVHWWTMIETFDGLEVIISYVQEFEAVYRAS